MTEFARRVLFAVPAAAGFLWVAWLGGAAFNAMFAVFALVIVFEMGRLFEQGPSAGVLKGVSFLLAAGVLSIGLLDLPVPLWTLPASLAVLMALYPLTAGGAMAGPVGALLTGAYAPVAFVLLMDLRAQGADAEGFFVILAVFMSIWGNDVFAYLGGRAIGKHKLAPRISPGKTWEGVAAGAIGAAAGFGIALWAWSRSEAAAGGLTTAGGEGLAVLWPLIVLVSVFGPVGDLMESRLKRLSGVKDSSHLLPGHGGFFDRFDAALLCSPVVWTYLNLAF